MVSVRQHPRLHYGTRHLVRGQVCTPTQTRYPQRRITLYCLMIYEVEEMLEARGCPEYRFYLVKWKGYNHHEGELVDPSSVGRRMCGTSGRLLEKVWNVGRHRGNTRVTVDRRKGKS